MPFWEGRRNQEEQPEQVNVGKKGVPAEGTKPVVKKETILEKKTIEQECGMEIRQLEVLRRMKKDPSWDLAVDTLLVCENNPSDAELIAAAINRRKLKSFSPFQRERYLGKKKPSKEESFHESSEGGFD